MNFPVLCQFTQLPEGKPPCDIYQLTYHQGATPDQDRLELPAVPVAWGPSDEFEPTWTDRGEPALVSNRDGVPRLYREVAGSLLAEQPCRKARFGPRGLAVIDGSGLYLEQGGHRQFVCDDPLAMVWSGADLVYSTWRHPSLHRWDGVKSHYLGPGRYSELAVSPEGTHVAYPAPHGLVERELAGGRERLLLQDSQALLSGPNYTPDGSRVLICRDAQPCAVPRAGGPAQLLWTDDEIVAIVPYPRSSRDEPK